MQNSSNLTLKIIVVCTKHSTVDIFSLSACKFLLIFACHWPRPKRINYANDSRMFKTKPCNFALNNMSSANEVYSSTLSHREFKLPDNYDKFHVKR